MCRTLRIGTLVIFQPCMSRDVKLGRKLKRMVWHAGARAWETQNRSILDLLPCFLFHFIFYFLLPPLPVFGRLWWAAGQYQGVSYPSPNLSSPRVPPSLAPSWVPLIFMWLTGQPCSASLSLSVGEEAVRCQQLMDFWKTQTVMHRRVENCGESGRKGRIWSDA